MTREISRRNVEIICIIGTAVIFTLSMLAGKYISILTTNKQVLYLSLMLLSLLVTMVAMCRLLKIIIEEEQVNE